jgi:small-conductance mechanosensitive channel
MNARWIGTLALAALCALPAHAGAQASATPSPSAEEAAVVPPTAPLVVDGVTLFRLRGIAAYPAERRVRDIAERIASIAADGSVALDSLSVSDIPEATLVMAGSQRVMGVVDADARLEGVSRQVLAAAYRQRIHDAIAAYRRDRDPAVLASAATRALGAALVLVAALVGAGLLYRRLRRGIESRYRTRVRDLQVHAFQIVRAERIWRAATGMLTVLWTSFVVVALYLCLRYVLVQFPWTRALGNGLWTVVEVPVRFFVEGAVQVFPKLVFLAVLAVVTRALLRIVGLFFDGVASGRVALDSFPAEWAAPTYRLVRLLIVGLAVVVAYPYIPGSQSDAFKGVTLFAGLVFSLGSSSFIGNMIAGYSMTYRRAFRVGDVIKVGDSRGVVVSSALMVTRLRTPKGEDVVVPNSHILNSEVVNYSTLARQGELVLHTTVGIGYETPWRQVEAMLLEAANRTESALREPKPFVLQTTLGDFAVTYELNVFCDAPERMAAIYSRLHQNILDVFNEYGVQIMTPAYEGDPEQPKIVPRSEWYQPPAAGATSSSA